MERLLAPYNSFAFLELCQPSLSSEEIEHERLEDSERGVPGQRGIYRSAESPNLAVEPLDVVVLVVVHLVRAARRRAATASKDGSPSVPAVARPTRAQQASVPVESPFKLLLGDARLVNPAGGLQPLKAVDLLSELEGRRDDCAPVGAGVECGVEQRAEPEDVATQPPYLALLSLAICPHSSSVNLGEPK